MKIENYSFGEMNVNGVVYKNDLIIYPDRIETDWWREQGHSLSINDLESILQYKPDYLIIGRGAYKNMNIPAKTLDFLKENRIEIISGDTQKMSNIFNQFLEENKKAVGAFHLTC
ncbi:MAG: MTH938/NDUFAF3 family protein [Calditrichaceae bacterium]|jgi:hypothetical protein